jgi:hypothetical protein
VCWLLCVLLAAPEPARAAQGSIDVSSLELGTPVVLAELDDSITGQLRQLAWSADGKSLYLLIVEGKPPGERARHFTLALEGGGLRPVAAAPGWAIEYWSVKQDRTAPGLPALAIQVEEKLETLKAGPGPSGVLDRTNPSALTLPTLTSQNLADGASGNQQSDVIRLKVLGQEIAVFVNEDKPLPGTRFSWGPEKSGALVFLGQKGELVFLDQKKRKRQVPEEKDAFLPAWSLDGSRLAYVRKTGGKTHLLWLTVGPKR